LKLSLLGKKRTPNHPNSPFLKRRKRKVKVDPKLGGQMEGEEEGSLLGGQWKEKKKVPCYLFPLPLKQFYLNLHFFLFIL
jgi:hypothetical protein